MTPRGGPGLGWIENTGLTWAADNDCFTGLDASRYTRMLCRIEGASPAFVTVPDIVGDASATMALFDEWEPVVRSHGLPPGLVAQDGLENMRVPWKRFEALFIGGSTGWKLGDAAANLVREAKRHGKWVHMGRVNSLRRIRRAVELECDSIDGTGFTMYSDIRIPLALRWIVAAEEQQTINFCEGNYGQG